MIGRRRLYFHSRTTLNDLMEKTNEQLVTELTQGDRSAYTAIYNQLFYKIFHFALAMVSRQEAEDICADLFTRLWEKRARFDTVNNIESFLMASVRHACLNYLRGAKRHFEIERDLQKTSEKVISLERSIEIRSLWRDLITKKIDLLPAQCQRIFRYAYIDGLTNPEIAQLLNISEKTVSNQKIRGVQLLREMTNINWLLFLLTLLSFLYKL